DRCTAPQSSDEARRQTGAANASPQSASKQEEFDPGCDAGGGGNSRCPELAVEPEQRGKSQRGRIGERRPQRHAQGSEIERRPRVPERVKGGGVEWAHGRRQEANRRADQQVPGVARVRDAKATCLKDRAGDHVAEEDKCSGRGDYEKGNPAQTLVQALAKLR